MNVMTQAFAKAGKKSPKDGALDILDRYWRLNKPDIRMTLEAFREGMREANPMLAAMLYPVDFDEAIRRFAYSNHAEIKKIVRSDAAIRANRKRVERYGYSMNPSAVAARNRKHARGQRAAAEIPVNDTIVHSPYAANHQAAVHRHHHGITRVKVDIDRTGQIIQWLGNLRPSINGRPLWEVTTVEALRWCEGREIEAMFVKRLCALIPDPRKPIGEQLTEEMVKEAKG